jgi:hypothetical protein
VNRKTFNAFTEEAGLSSDAGNAEGGDLTLETLLEEKYKFDIALRFEKLGVGDEKRGWTKPGAHAEQGVYEHRI